jgi:uncharacterized protein YdeI (YjbR/CyaY-like superfamily)
MMASQKPLPKPKARSFASRDAFRAWLDENHATAKELILRCFKVHARERGIGYKEALDEALCFGWIDGVRKGLDEDSFTQRFTPRKAKSNWSHVNIKRVQELIAEGRMHSAGLAAFEARAGVASGAYSFENRSIQFAPELAAVFQANPKAWKFFASQPPGYRRTCTFYVMSAKRPETRERRLARLIELSAQGERLPMLG